jgi:hypothetical protein
MTMKHIITESVFEMRHVTKLDMFVLHFLKEYCAKFECRNCFLVRIVRFQSCLYMPTKSHVTVVQEQCRTFRERTLLLWFYSPSLGLDRFFSFLIVYQSVGFLGRGISPRKVSTCTQNNTDRINT